MNKKQIHTIIMQEEKIQELTEQCRQLRMGYESIWDQNQRLRKRLNRYEKQENELNKVNT